MIEKKYIDLINREVDQRNSPRRRRILHEYLEKNAEAKRLYDDLISLSATLSAVKLVEPPANLKKEIMNTIPHSSLSAQSSRRLLWHSIQTLLFGKKVRLVYVLSVGIVVMLFFILYGVHKNDILKVGDLYGIIGMRSIAPDYNLLQQLDISNGRLRGNLRVSGSPTTVLVDLGIENSQEVRISIEFNGSEVKFLEFHQSFDRDNTLKTEQNSINMTTRGVNSFQFVFHRQSNAREPLSFRIFSGDSLIRAYALPTQ